MHRGGGIDSNDPPYAMDVFKVERLGKTIYK